MLKVMADGCSLLSPAPPAPPAWPSCPTSVGRWPRFHDAYVLACSFIIKHDSVS